MKISKKDLTLPKVLPEEVKNTYTHVRPYRKGGLRLEHELINDKHIFHNYGQGGSEVCLAYGCSYISAKSIQVKVEPNKLMNVAVLGSGIVGVMTALQLLKRGHRVTVYSKNIPKLGEMNPKNRVASQISAHPWFPAYYDNEDPLKHELISKLSYDYFKDCIETSRYQSISWANMYTRGPKNAEMQDIVTQFISQDFTNIYLDFGNQRLEEYVCFKTFLIDSEFLLEELITEAKLRNANFEVRNFNNIEDILKLNQDCIVNCMGLGSKAIFDDQQLQGIKGHLIELPLFGLNVTEPFMIRSTEETEDSQIQIYVTPDRILIGNSWEVGDESCEPNKETIDRIMLNVHNFVKHRSIRPSKL